MKYLDKSFTVQQRGREAATCGHGWLDARGRCVFCGESPRTSLSFEDAAAIVGLDASLTAHRLGLRDGGPL